RHTRSKRDWSSDVCSSDLAMSWWLMRVKEPGPTTYPLKCSGTFWKLFRSVKPHLAMARLRPPLKFSTPHGRVDGPLRICSREGKIGRASCRERQERVDGRA